MKSVKGAQKQDEVLALQSTIYGLSLAGGLDGSALRRVRYLALATPPIILHLSFTMAITPSLRLTDRIVLENRGFNSTKLLEFYLVKPGISCRNCG
jgi:hypothetical protein